jgi:hypothetical protein
MNSGDLCIWDQNTRSKASLRHSNEYLCGWYSNLYIYILIFCFKNFLFCCVKGCFYFVFVFQIFFLRLEWRMVHIMKWWFRDGGERAVWVREGVVVKEGGGREGVWNCQLPKKPDSTGGCLARGQWISFIGKVKMLPLAFILYELWLLKGNDVLFGCIHSTFKKGYLKI